MQLPAGLRRVLPLAAPLTALVLFAVWEIHYRGTYGYSTSFYPIDDADEWRYTACSRLAGRGYALFSQVFSAQPPMLFLSLSSGMRVFGDSIQGARWVEILFGALSLVSCSWLAWLLEGPIAAGASALLLAVSPAFLLYSHTVEGEGPMMALTTLALALACAHRRTGRRSLAGMAGLVLACAVLMKLFAVGAAAPALCAIGWSRSPLRERLEVVFTFLATLVVPVVLDFLLIHPRQQWEQVVQMHGRVASLTLPGTTPPLRLMAQFLAVDPGLSALALGGLVALVALHCRFEAVFLGLWSPGSVLMLLLFRPLFPHHLAILLAPLAVSAGVGMAAVVRQRVHGRRLWTPAVAGALLLYLAFLPRLWHEDRHMLLPAHPATFHGLVAYVQRHSSPTDFVVLDDLSLAERANRLVPPPLCDPSNVRVRAGYLGLGDLVYSTRRYRASLVLPSRGIFLQVQGYTAWLDAHYARTRAPDGTPAWLIR